MSSIGTLSQQGGLPAVPQQESLTLGEPRYSPSLASLGVPQQEPAQPDRPYENVGKLQMNLLGGNATLEPGQQPNETGGLVTGLLGAVGGTFGQPGQEVGQAIGKAIEVPLGLGGNVLGAVGSVPIPFMSEIAGIIGAGYRAVTGSHEGDKAPTVLEDLISPFQQPGGVTLGGLFQTSVGTLGLMGRAVERAYAGTRKAGDLPPDIEQAIANGTITREEGVDQAVARGQGFSNDAMHNILWSIMLDPLTWLSLGVGGVAKAAGAGVKIGRAAEIAGMIEKGVDVAPDAARLLRLGELPGVAGRVTDATLAAAEMKKLGPLERLSLNTIGRMPGFNEVLVPVSNQVIRLTDPLKLFSGGKIGVRTAEVVATSATAGTATAYGLDTVHHIGGIIDGLVSGGRARVNRGIGILTTNYMYRFAADDLAHEFAKAGHIPGIDGEAGKAMNPTVFMRGVMERSPLDASVGADIEVMAEKLKPFDNFAKETDRTADTAKRLAYATGGDETGIVAKLKGTFNEWALSHALSYVEASRKLVEDVQPALAAMDNLPEAYADASRFTLVAKDTLTHGRWERISKLVEEGKDLDTIREEVGKYADFNWMNPDGLSGDELLDALKRWGNENADGLLKEVDVRLPSGALKGDVPAPLKEWLDGVEPMGYTLTLMPPEGAERAAWRVTRDADGKIININPFLQFQTEAQMMKDPRWFQRLMSQGFRQIRTERILWTMRRRFVTSMAQDGRMSESAANSIYKSIMYSANERGMTPRALRPSEIMEAAKRALKTEQVKGNVGLGTMSEVELTKRLVVAFEGDLSLVGLTQKLTGKAKVVLPGAAENTWGQIAERLYPMARFSLNHFFMVQEIVEPYILNIMRGIPVPLNRHSEGFERAVAMRNAMDNLVRSDLTPDGVMMEMAEYQKIIQAGMQQAHTFYGSGTRLGRAIGGMWGQTASRKAAAEGLMAMRVTGDLMKDTFTQMRGPEFWAELERLYQTTDTAVIAERWLAQSFHIADGNGERITAIMDLVKPENLGPATRVFKGKGPGVRWHHVAGILGMTEDGADEKLLESLRNGRLIDTAIFQPVEGAMTYAQWMRKATDAGMDEKFADRAYKMATGPEVDEFWQGWHDVMAGTTATKEIKDQSTRAIRGITQARARVMGLSEEEFIKLHYAAPPGFSQEAAIAGADALFQSVDNIARVIVERHGAPPGVEFMNRESLLGAISENREAMPRAGQGATDLGQLTESIRTKGFDPRKPITLIYDPHTHKVSIYDGNTRMAAANRLGLENVPVQVKVLPSGGGKFRGKFIPVPGVAKEGLVAHTFVAPSDVGLTTVGATNSMHAVMNGLPENFSEPSQKFQARVGSILLQQDSAARDAERAAAAIPQPPARFATDARGNMVLPPQFKPEEGYLYRTVNEVRAANDWRVGEYAAIRPATIYATDADTAVLLRVREGAVEWDDATGGVGAMNNRRAKNIVPASKVEMLGADGTWRPVKQAEVIQPHEVMGALPPEEAGHHYFNYLAVNDPERLRALLPQLPGQDAHYVSQVLDRVDTLKGRGRFTFKNEQGLPYFFGSVEPQDLVEMAVKWMPEHEGLAAKNWYIGIREGISNLFGPTNADTVLRMFSVSQANASPINGMMNVLRALEQSFAMGFEKGSIGQREFLTAAVRKVAGEDHTLQLNAENIVKAMLDLPIDRNYAAKLNDFTDSVLGNSTRRWTGRAGGNMPVAVDRHTARDVGYMDQKVLTHLADSPYATHLPNGVVVIRDDSERVVVTMKEDITTKMKEVTDPETGEVTMKQVSESRWNLVNEDGRYVDRQGNELLPFEPTVYLGQGGRVVNPLNAKEQIAGLIEEHGGAGKWWGTKSEAEAYLGGDGTMIISGRFRPTEKLKEYADASGVVAPEDGVVLVTSMEVIRDGKRVPLKVRKDGYFMPIGGGKVPDGLDPKDFTGDEMFRSLEEGVVPFNKPKEIKPVAAFDMEGRPDDLQYENGVDVINRATDLFNSYVDPVTGRQGVFGQTNWRPEEVQAVGWMRVQKTLGGAEESPMDTLTAHHYPVAYEVSAEDGSPWARSAPLFEDMPDLARKQMIGDLDTIFAQWARENLGVNITSAGFVGDARWGGGYRTYSAPGMLMGTAESADDIADLRALVFRQKEVWAYHPAPISNYVRPMGAANDATAHYPALDIIIPMGKHGDTDTADELAHRIQDALDAPGCTVFPDATGNLRLRVVDRPLNPDTYELDTNHFFFKQHEADGVYPDGRKFKAGMADEQDVLVKLGDALDSAGINPDDYGIDAVINHGTVYIAGPTKNADGVVEWEKHLETAVGNIRGRGRTVDAGRLGDLQSQINTALDAHLQRANPTRYNDLAAGGAVLHDRRTAGILGYTRRVGDGRVIVGATQRANVTTGLHELAHVFATDLDESARELIQRTRASTIAAQRTDLDARIAALDVKIAGARSRTTKAKYRNQRNALVNDLGELVDETGWGPQHEEWFADEFNRWVKNGRVENRELNGLFEHFRNWLSEVWDTIRGHKTEQPSPEMQDLFNSMFDNRVPTVPYDMDQGALMLAGKQKVRQGMDNAGTTQYFKKGRSFVERSLNHPFLGMYPASYYWGKILPEMIKFIALRPFGMKTPFLAWNALREVSDTVRMQQSLDPSIKQWLKDNEEGIMTINMLFPAVPNDIPVNAPLWARRIAEQGLENADRVAQGQAAKPIDYMKGVADSAAWVFGPYSSLQRLGGILGSAGDIGRGAIKEATGVDLTTGAVPDVVAASEAINPFTGKPFAATQ